MSLWYLDYEKTEGEMEKLHISNNYIEGFIQRMDEKLRKHSFGVFGVYGKEGCYEVRGMVLWRGIEVPQPMNDHSQFEYWKRTKLDPKKVADRKALAEFWKAKEGEKVKGLECHTKMWYK